MKKDTHITKMVFRKWSDGEIIALMPEIVANTYGSACDSYMNIGQHGGANYSEVIAATKPAKKHEIRDLKKELEGIGYRIKVMQTRTPQMLNEFNKRYYNREKEGA